MLKNGPFQKLTQPPLNFAEFGAPDSMITESFVCNRFYIVYEYDYKYYSSILHSILRRVSRGGAQGAWAPPLEIKKKKKKKKKKKASEQILSYFTYILLLF